MVLDAIRANLPILLQEGWVTCLESLLGFLLAFALGVPIAVAVSSSRTLSAMFYPILIATQSLPKVALAPLVLVWLGLGIESKLAIAWLVAFFPIVVDTATGLRSTPAEYLDLATSVRANAWQTFYKIRFPAALPFVISGSKVAITLAVIGAVIGEFVGSTEGLGNLLLVANSQINTPLAFACARWTFDPRYRALWRGGARRTRARALDGRDQARLNCGDRMMEPIALDIHVHQIPIDPERLAGLPGVHWHADAGQIEIDGHKVAFASLFKPAALIEWLGANAIEQAWVSIPPPAYRQQLDATASRQWIDYLNNGLHALCARTRIGCSR